MAWTVPRTWTAGEIVTAAALNADLRDNLNELSLHTHTGGSGSGSSGLSNLTWEDFSQAAVPAAPGGTLTRVFATTTLLGWINVGGTFYAATSGHTHAFSNIAVLTTGETTAAGGATSIDVREGISASATTTLIVTTYTAGGTGSRTIFAMGIVAFQNVLATGGTNIIELRRDATIIATALFDHAVGYKNTLILVSTAEGNRPSGSVTYGLFFRSSATGTVYILESAIVVKEFGVA